MKKLLVVLLICSAMACKKDQDATLTKNDWLIESATVSPAMTSGGKTSTNYIELMGPSSCVATTTLSFSDNGTFSSGSNGALCDLMSTGARTVTWRRDGDQVFLSTAPDSPLTLKGKKLTQIVKVTEPGGSQYTFTYVYKAK